MHTNLHALVEPVLTSFGLELVEIVRLPSGILRIDMDTLSNESRVNIEDCERVTRQLQALFTVENVEYERLEVASAGTDRPLFTLSHFTRFIGENVAVKLIAPFEGRKNFAGILLSAQMNEAGAVQVRLALQDDLGTRKKKSTPTDPLEMSFTLDELEWAKLSPILNFRSQK